MGKLDSLISQVRDAAKELKAKIAELDEQIAAAHHQRGLITAARVSKADFMAYIAEDIRRRGQSFARKIRYEAERGVHEYGRLEQIMRADNGSLSYPYLTGQFGIPVAITDDAMYWYFADLMVKRLADALDTLDWPEDAMPAVERKAALDKLDTEIKQLNQARDELASQLIEAGLAS